MEAIAVFYGGVIVACLVYGARRKHLMMQHPEKYERVQKVEKADRDRKLKIAGQVVKVAIKGTIWLLINMHSKRRR
jgi:hypothetical protein